MSAVSLAAPSFSRSRALALGILAAALGMLWLGAVRPLLGAYVAQQRELSRMAEMRETFGRILAERPELERRREALATAEAGQRLTLAAESDGLAGAALQRLVKAAIDRSGATVQSTQMKPVRPDGAFRRVGLRVQMTGTVEALRQSLLALEASQPLIYGEALELRARGQLRSNGKTVTEDRTLEIRLDVYGLARLPT